MNVIRQAMLIASLSVLASVAQAKDLAHDLHLSLDASIVSWTRRTSEVGDLFSNDDTVLQAGFPSAVGARVGYLPLDVLEVGLRVALDFQHYEAGGQKLKYGTYDVHAYARYVARGDRVRLFVGPLLGATFSKSVNPGEDDVALTTKQLSVGAELGAYGFLADSFSIDPFVAFTYTNGSADLDAALGAGYDISGYQLKLGLALSGWL